MAEDVMKKAEFLPALAREMCIDTPERYEFAGQTLKTIKALRSEITGVFKPIIERAHAAHKEALSQQKKAEQPLADAELMIKSKMIHYDEEQELRRKEEEARLREEAKRREEERLLREAEQAEAEGDTEYADMLLDTGICAPSVVVPSVVPKVDGISYRDNWKARVYNEKIIPREYLTVDVQKLDKLAKAMRGTITIPGVEFYNERVATVRGVS